MAKSELIYGIHAVRHALDHLPQDVLEAWVQESAQSDNLSELRGLLRDLGIATHRANTATLDKLSSGGVHQGIIIRCRQPSSSDTPDLDELLGKADLPLFLILDGVQDPHNLGACLRAAAAAGVTAVVIPKDRAVGMTETVRKVASGGAEIVPLLRVTNLARTLATLKENGVWLVGCAAEAQASLYATDLNRPLAIIMGSEGKGMRRLTRDNCDYLANIPMNSQIESLNVSVATGICLFEALRQRG